MKTPIDSTGHAGATLALINSGVDYQMADLWVFTLNGGGVVRWTSAPQALTFTSVTAAGGTYALGPLITRGPINTKVGLEVATLEVTFNATLADLINGTSIVPFTVARGFDGAQVTLYRALLTAWGQPVLGVVIEFKGQVTAIKDIYRGGFKMTVSSSTILLNVNMGPDVFQAACLNTHYDADCGLSPTNVPGVVAASPGARAFNSNLTNPNGYFDKGIVTFTSGVNNGLQRTVQSYLNASGALAFAFGFPAAPAPGDTFNAVRGCLLTMVDCTAQGNLLKFRGTPFIPPATTGALG